MKLQSQLKLRTMRVGMQKNEGISSQDLSLLKSAIDEAAIVAITDNFGVITYANDKFCKISKYSREELIGKTHRIINSGYHSKEFFIEMWRKISIGQTWEGEICNRAKDGSHYWVNTTIVPFMDENKKPVKYVAVRYEITERKRAEEQLRIYANKLEVSNRELQDFASVAAHDLQEPLRKIQAFSDQLKTKIQVALTTETQEIFDRMQSSAQRMRTLINDLLKYSRVTTKAQPFSKINLNDVLSHVVSDLEVRLEQSLGKVKWRDLPMLEAEPNQMLQLFQNLIGNALKFSKTNVPPVVTVEGKIEGANCQISVSDNGIGFDEKYLDRIFTVFQRLHGRHEFEGTGIGLAICRKIIERHGGAITAKSQEGEGSTFIVTLPLKQKTGE